MTLGNFYLLDESGRATEAESCYHNSSVKVGSERAFAELVAISLQKPKVQNERHINLSVAMVATFLAVCLSVCIPKAAAMNTPIGSAFRSVTYNPKIDGPYSCDKYLLHLQQELGYLPQSIVSFSLLISKLERPEADSDKESVVALSQFEPFGDEHVPHEKWLHLLYACTVEMPSSDHMAMLPRKQVELLKASDSILQRVVKLGLTETVKVLRSRGLYDEGHYFHSRDTEGNNLMHLAAKSGNIIILRELAEILKDGTIDLLEGPYSVNKAGKRPWDVANDSLDFQMAQELNGLYEIYKIETNDRQIPKKPPNYTLPEIRVLEKNGAPSSRPIGGSDDIVLPPGWNSETPKAEPRRNKSGVSSQAPIQAGSQVLSADVMRDLETTNQPIVRKGRGSRTRTLIASLAFAGVFIAVGGGAAYYVVTKKAVTV